MLYRRELVPPCTLVELHLGGGEPRAHGDILALEELLALAPLADLVAQELELVLCASQRLERFLRAMLPCLSPFDERIELVEMTLRVGAEVLQGVRRASSGRASRQRVRERDAPA